MTTAELARRTGTQERNVGEWLAVATGAPSRFGWESRRRCAHQGRRVVLSGTDEGGLVTTVARLKPDGPSLALRSDVSSAHSGQPPATSTYPRVGACHLLFNN